MASKESSGIPDPVFPGIWQSVWGLVKREGLVGILLLVMTVCGYVIRAQYLDNQALQLRLEQALSRPAAQR